MASIYPILRRGAARTLDLTTIDKSAYLGLNHDMHWRTYLGLLPFKIAGKWQWPFFSRRIYERRYVAGTGWQYRTREETDEELLDRQW